jgi:hypothetical protein
MLVFVFAACTPLEPGTWKISGTDARLGAFSGLLEIRQGEGEALQALRVVTLKDLVSDDGREVEAAWTGSVEAADRNPGILRFSLTRADFIPRVSELERTEADGTPLAVEGKAAKALLGRDLRLSYAAVEDPGFGIEERAAYLGPPAADPLFVSERQVLPTHPEPGPVLKALLFKFFESYHALPEVQPYVEEPAFQKAVHDQIVDHTDFDYYRANPGRLRVVNKVADPISLAETSIRANAYRAFFHEKAERYQQEMTERFVGPHGMVVNSITAEGVEVPDHDAALWTGVYAYTEALRYQATGEPAALEDVRRTVRAILTLMDITGNPRAFARTLRLRQPELEPGWHHGTGSFAYLDWEEKGNNDMAQGLLIGMVAGWEVLPIGDALRDEVAAHALALLEQCEFMADPPDEECGSTGAGLGLPSLNPGAAWLLAGVTHNDPELLERGRQWLNDPLLLLYPMALGGGPFYVFGVSDWSGNHLTLVSTIVLQQLLERTPYRILSELWHRASGRAWQILSTLELPLHAALAAGLGVLEEPAEQEEARSQALWGLRSFPFPKHPYSVDHRIRADFVLSPFPSLPWYMDWETDPGRQSSLTGYGILETSVDSYRWNAGPFDIASAGIAGRDVPGGDFLFLYWLARSHGLIEAGD